MKSFLQSKNFLFLLSFLLWLFCFKGFLFGDLLLSGDAMAYYEHFDFFCKNISRGVIPLWEATRDNGVPSEFFLRRIGEFNPFYGLIIVINKLGVPYLRAYLLFQALYFFLGMVGFYNLARHVLKDDVSAFVAYLLLMFSSSSALLFNSFIFLIFTPMAWFFYFLFVFVQRPCRKFLLGATFCSMILSCTYIPFYFLTVFLSFSLFFVIFYFHALKRILVTCLQFMEANKLFLMICVLLWGVSMVPGVLFFQESQRGEFILPSRNPFYMQTDNVLEVVAQNTSQGGVIATNFNHEPFANLKNITPGVFYIPIFCWILLLFGLRVGINRKLGFMLCWGVGIYFMSVLEAGPIYKFFYQYIFYFKYFRNFQFFLWLVLLPLFILICCEHMRLFFSEDRMLNLKGISIPRVIFLVFIHGMLVVLLSKEQGVVLSSYFSVGMSLLMFLFYEFNFHREKYFLGLALFLLIIIVQPVEVYHYLEKNAPFQPNLNSYRYSAVEIAPYLTLSLPSEDNAIIQNNLELRSQRPSDIYFSTTAFAFLKQNLNNDIIDHYTQSRLLVYDHAENLDYQDLNFEEFARLLLTNANTAFIFPSKFNREDKRLLDSMIGDVPLHLKINLSDAGELEKAMVVLKNSPEVQVRGVDVNYLKLRTNFSSKKFLVYNDNFYTGWQAFINKKAAPLFRANLAFKGVWVPAGEQEVYFRFGTAWRHGLKFLIMFLFYGVLVYFFHLLKTESYENVYTPNQ